MPTIRFTDLTCHVLRMDTRFPFHYGIAAMTAAPHVFFRAELEIGGETSIGIVSEGLPPKWFTKNPESTFDEDLPEMLDAIAHAAEAAQAIGEQPTFFDWWQALYQAQHEWANEKGVPFLLAHLGTSLMERAAIDGFCRAIGKSFQEAVLENDFGLDLGKIHPELAGDFDLAAILTQQGSLDDPTLFARHTVGLIDPLTDADIPEGDAVNDGLPQSLEACISEYGLKYFKIKICGDFDRDRTRLIGLAELFERTVPDYRYTLDGNEQFRSMADFRDHWDRHCREPQLAELLSTDHLIFVEQPVHRDEALAEHVAADLHAWPNHPPLIIDESDATIDSARRALELGYAGTSHKNCKGIIKGIANACLLRKRAAENPDRPAILSGEDLGNVGPVALLQDLAAMHLLGVGHVERNGHHYFRGLSVYDEPVQEAVLKHHGDLYRQHPAGFPTLEVKDGKIDLRSVIAAPFGTAFRIDDVLGPWEPLEALRERGVFLGY